ncbi:small ribosomal subunit protein mS40 [Petromyzon marinus]|uniref:small ribosomal subunit protein mS40 n=1 Tax=Petromyzon marinus TaxID=7757 RepID=UPI003F6F5B5F
MAGMALSLRSRSRLAPSLLVFPWLPAARRGEGAQVLRRAAAPSTVRPTWPAAPPLWRPHCTAATEESTPAAPDPLAHLRQNPWEYLDSEEYIERYGEIPIWKDYRRNHKGGIPPQKTRKTCIRGSNVCSNPCPACRDPKIIMDFKNIRLLQQFICPHQGIVFDPSLTGLCQRQHKNLLAAIKKAQDYGLLLIELPLLAEPATPEDFTNAHGAVSLTPPPPHCAGGSPGDPWYPWYAWRQPPARDVEKLRGLYKGFLKKDRQ